MNITKFAEGIDVSRQYVSKVIKSRLSCVVAVAIACINL